MTEVEPRPAWRQWSLWCSLAYAGLIFGLSSLPAKALPKVDIWNADKFVHFAEYGAFAGLLCWLFSRVGAKEVPTWRPFVWAWLLASLYGFSDEWHQSFVPGRFSSLKDAAANMLGAAVVCGIFALLARSRRGSR